MLFTLILGLLFWAVIKASMVGWYFMHLKFEGRWVYFMLIPAGILAAILTLALPSRAHPRGGPPRERDRGTASSVDLELTQGEEFGTELDPSFLVHPQDGDRHVARRSSAEDRGRAQLTVVVPVLGPRIEQTGSDEAREIPRWLSQQRERNRSDDPRQEAAPSQVHPDRQARLAGELEALRRCREWLKRLDRGEMVVVNLRSETDPETEYVSSDRPRVLRMLARIIADLDELAGLPPIADEGEANVEDAEARRVRHRQRLAEPDPPPKRLSMWEERAALRASLDLPPSERG